MLTAQNQLKKDICNINSVYIRVQITKQTFNEMNDRCLTLDMCHDLALEVYTHHISSQVMSVTLLTRHVMMHMKLTPLH